MAQDASGMMSMEREGYERGHGPGEHAEVINRYDMKKSYFIRG